MIKAIAVGLPVLLFTGVDALGQQDDQFSMNPTISVGERQYRVCPDRPQRSDWVENLPGKEAYRALLISEIYKRDSYRRIVESGDCSCGTRFPVWASAEEEYNSAYRFLDQPAHTGARREVRREANDFRNAAKRICENHGNW